MWNGNNPDLLARVRMYTANEGRQRNPIIVPVFGCPFGFAGEYFDCRMWLGQEALGPGGQREVSIKFLCPELIKPRLKVGDRFTLWEMGDFADGVVLNVI